MTTLIQAKILNKKIKDGWVTISGPYSSSTPIGGPILLLNDVNDICWLMPDGTEIIMTTSEQFEFIHNKI